MKLRRLEKLGFHEYEVSRSSLYGDGQPPCNEAERVEILRVDRRSVDDPKGIPGYGGEDNWWYGSGANHRVENGCICRDMGYQSSWIVTITSLDQLMEFTGKYGQCVISQDGIEIYDGYRE